MRRFTPLRHLLAVAGEKVAHQRRELLHFFLQLRVQAPPSLRTSSGDQ